MKRPVLLFQLGPVPYPLGVAVALAIQWNVLVRPKRAGAAVWKGRSYPVAGA